MDSRKHQLAATFWAGLAAPVGLYAALPAYPVYVAAQSVPWSFAKVGIDLNARLIQSGGKDQSTT